MYDRLLRAMQVHLRIAYLLQLDASTLFTILGSFVFLAMKLLKICLTRDFKVEGKMLSRQKSLLLFVIRDIINILTRIIYEEL